MSDHQQNTSAEQPLEISSSYHHDDQSISSKRSRKNSSFLARIFRKSAPPSLDRSSHYEPPNTTGSHNRSRKNPLKRFKGFSTSISAMFLDETLVCPSAAWCGILSSSRTEHFLHVRNQKRKLQASEFRPPSRIVGVCLVTAVVGVVITYLIWGFGSTSDYQGRGGDDYYYYNRNLEMNKNHVPNVMRFQDYRERFWLPLELMAKDIIFQNKRDQEENDDPPHFIEGDGMERSLGVKNILDDQEFAYNIRAILCILFFVVLGIFGRRRRMKTRFAVLKARTDDDKIFYGTNRIRLSKSDLKMMKPDKYDGACSHTLCGCFPVDKLEGDDEKDPDCMNAGCNRLSKCCCGTLCRMWIQCFSICALAQEAREARLLLPPKDQRVDYITHQPFEEYFKDVHFLRRKWKTSHEGYSYGWKSHFAALSQLSRYILITFVSATILIIVTEQYNPRAIFSWADACVLIMTFIQSFVVLGIVHGLFHKSDLSLDAVIKFFGAGFIVATPMAFLVEVIVVNILMALYYGVALIVALLSNGGVGAWLYDNYRYFLVVSDILVAFLVAAASEEICKYYTFRSVEHPDLIFLTGLDRLKQDVTAKIGGGEAYPYSSNNASSMECRSVASFDSKFVDTVRNGRKNHRGDSPNPKGSLSRRQMKGGQEDYDIDIRTVRQKAAAVTTAMISTAVGLACAENFIYVFFLSGSNTQEEITMLLFRSVFPVHALCAGMQSIGIIAKFLEEGNDVDNIGVGRIVFPAILLHGSFDSILMLINSFVDIAADADDDRFTDYNTTMLNTIAACCVTSVMIIGATWYWKRNRQQKTRLKVQELAIQAQVSESILDDLAPNAVEGRLLELL